MNSIINFVLKNKFAVWIMTFIILAAGIYAGTTMKMEQMPSIKLPVVSVTTMYPGATPDDVSEKVTKPIEQSIQNINGVENFESKSYPSASSVQIIFDYDKDLDKATKEINDALAKAPLPEGVGAPVVSTFTFDQIPILGYGIKSGEMGLEKLTELVERDLVPSLEGIEGVQSADVTGQQLTEVQIKFHQDLLAMYGLTETMATQMIQGATARFPLGVMELDKSEKSVVIDGKIMTLPDLKAIKFPAIPVSGAAGGQGQSQSAQGSSTTLPTQEQLLMMPTITLGELADVEKVGKVQSIARTNGDQAISFAIVKSQTGNTVEVADQVAEKIKKFEKDNDVEMIKIMDMATPVKDSVSTMIGKALFGALFAVLIIWFFLRSIKSTLIAIVSIPLSLLIAIFLLKQVDVTLNIMSLGALTVAIGRVIDDSIVVIENIFRRMSNRNEQLTGKDLIREATKQVFKPIMSSTLVTIAVFLPMGLVGGMVGEMFLPFALAIVFALLASLLIAITVVPMLTHMFFKNGLSKKFIHEEGKHSKLALKYRSILDWSLSHKIIPTVIVLLLFAGSIALPATGLLGANMMSSEADKMIYVTFKPNPGQTLDDVDMAVQKVEKLFLEKTDVESVQISAGGENPFTPGDNKSAILTAQYKKDSKNFTKEKEQVLADLKEDNAVGIWKEPNFGMGGTSTISYNVFGPKMIDLTETVNAIEKIMTDNENLKDVSSTMQEAYDEYTFVVDQEKATKLGLSSAQIGLALYPNQKHPVITTVKENNDELSVYIEGKKDNFTTVEDIKNKKITSPLGVEVRLGDIVTVNEGKTSDTITRRDGKIYAAVNATPTDKDITKASKEVQEKIDDLNLPKGISVEAAGAQLDMEESFGQLFVAMGAAVAIVYLILVLTFGGALAPFAVLFALPLTVIGALFGLFIAGEVIEATSLIGMLMLIGIVVTNAIVFIDRVIRNQKKGLSVRESLLEAGVTRLRPILMTAIATIGALIPLALGFESSAMISKTLAITVIGGLTSSTLLTLLIVPMVYESLTNLKNWVFKLFRKKA